MIEFSKSNFIVKVNVDSKISNLQNELESQDQFIPIGPFDIDFTIKEIIDFNLFGGYVEKFGQAKDWVINIGLKTKNQNLVLGADVAKNVSGYNLSRLMVGARGKLGKINWVTFRTLPIHKKQNYSSQILNGLRLIVLPEFISKIVQCLNDRSIEFVVYEQISVIDISSKDQLLDIEKFIQIKYELIDGISHLIAPDEKNSKIIKRIKSNFRF